MTSLLLAWRDTYNRILSENGASTPSMQCMAFAIACQQHSLTLQEFVSERKALNVPAAEVFAPSLMATISDWDDSWDTLKRLLHLEDSHLERVIIDYCRKNQPLAQEAYTMFKSVVEQWTHASHRVVWYKGLTPQQSENTIFDAFASRERYRPHLHIKKEEAVEHCLYNITTSASPTFWTKFTVPFLESFQPTSGDSQRMALHLLQHAPVATLRVFVPGFQTQWEKAPNWNIDHFAQWISDVIAHQPQYSGLVLDGVLKKNASVLQSPIINSNTVVIDYFLNQGIAKVSGSQQVRNVLNALVNGEGSDALRERAWIKKLALFGAKPNDLKMMQTWTPVMGNAFNYWLATAFEKHGPKAPNNVYTHINREIGWEYERRFQIDLRNPEGFQAWRKKCQNEGSDPFAALAANSVLCDTWEQGCAFYSANAAQPQMALSGVNFELFVNDVGASFS